jgi:uncharacterized membrane protein
LIPAHRSAALGRESAVEGECDMMRIRYARGEISRDEYRERLDDLE